MKHVLLSFFFVLSQLILQAQTVNVSTPAELQNALNAATAGQTIVLAKGYYKKSGGFSVPVGISGTKNQPIILQGAADVTISSGSLTSGYGFYLQGNNNYWIIDGFHIRYSAKGIVSDSGCHNIISNLNVHFVGGEGIHLRSFSSYNKVENCFVDSTGRDLPQWTGGYAEGIYVGSANSNWSKYTKGNPDTSNYNHITGNVFGDSIISENIDIKEGTKWGVVSNNTFNGKGLNGANSADSWVDAKGDYWTIECNTGTFVKGLPGASATANGFQDHENSVSSFTYGHNNTFSNNTSNIDANQYALYLHKTGMSIVCSNNTVTGGQLFKGTLANCTNANSCMTTGIKNVNTKKYFSLYPNPASTYIQVNGNLKTNYFITNVLGEVVKSGSTSNENSVISIGDLNSGCYILNTTEEKNALKFIKE